MQNLELYFLKWHEEFSPTFESLKIGSSLGAFIQSRKCVGLKFIGDLCVMRIKNDAKFEEQLTCQFKIEFSNLMNFESSTQKSPKFEF